MYLTDCQRRNVPPNSRLDCESNRYALGSKCTLICDNGYIPLLFTQTTCIIDDDTGEYEWDVEEALFACVPPIGFVIGGIDNEYKYVDTVEVVAPGFTCSSTDIPVYPHKVVGTVSGYITGHNIVCGGALMEYTDCSLHPEKSQHCKTNIECVDTAGGTKWCTGPKIQECYSYDTVSKVWNQVLNLKTARALASGTVTSSGNFWVSGGYGKTKILDTTEVISHNG